MIIKQDYHTGILKLGHSRLFFAMTRVLFMNRNDRYQCYLHVLCEHIVGEDMHVGEVPDNVELEDELHGLVGVVTPAHPLVPWGVGSTSIEVGSTSDKVGSTSIKVGSTTHKVGSTSIKVGSTSIRLGVRVLRCVVRVMRWRVRVMRWGVRVIRWEVQLSNALLSYPVYG